MFGADAVTPRTLGDGPALRWMRAPRLFATVVALCAAALLTVASSAWATQTATYSAEQTIPVPPASNFAGSGGGDGWAVALSSNQVFNVFHHQATMQVACHNQSDASQCWVDTITDGSGNNFGTSAHPGMYLDQSTGKLYVYATRSDDTAGVVCVDTTAGATSSDPFCGFTALTAVGDAPLPDMSNLSNPVLIGNHLYAYNFFPGAGQTTDENQMLCFDVSTDAACSGQPFAVNLGASPGTDDDTSYPSPTIVALGTQIVVPTRLSSGSELACLDDSTHANCAGSWPVSLSGTSYTPSSFGGAFPLLSASGALQGLCLPDGTDECFNLNGSSAATPTGLGSVVPGTSGWNGPALTLGPRVYVPNGNSDVVDCYDYSAQASCVNFPKTFSNLGLLYTVNVDPQRPTCIWVNSDDGSEQIQNFDAYSGGACGQGAIRVLASQFVVDKTACFPTAYQSLQVVSPARGSYSDGSIAFQDGDGNPIAGASNLALDPTGTVSLKGLNLNSPTGLPQFIITLKGQSGSPGQVVVKLVWTATYDPACAGPGITVGAPPPAPSSQSKPAAPANVSAPTVSGRSVPGARLTCAPGDWSGNPSSFTYTWTRNGKVISGATGETYLVGIFDEGARIACVVTAHNAGGTGTASSGRKWTVLCPEPSGKVRSGSVGVFVVGESQGKARKRLNRFRVTHNHFDNFCLYHGWGIRLGYPSAQLLGMLGAHERKSLKGKVVLALTANRFYALDGVRPGARVASVAHRLHLGTPFHVGRNFWYFVHGSGTVGVLKVRRGVIQEIGLASKALTRTRAQQHAFIRSFNDV